MRVYSVMQMMLGTRDKMTEKNASALRQTKSIRRKRYTLPQIINKTWGFMLSAKYIRIAEETSVLGTAREDTLPLTINNNCHLSILNDMTDYIRHFTYTTLFYPLNNTTLLFPVFR
jgi:hypothetical protein